MRAHKKIESFSNMGKFSFHAFHLLKVSLMRKYVKRRKKNPNI